MSEQTTTVVDKGAKTRQVTKMLRQAESLPEGSPERDAFMEKVLAMSAAYSIDLALARAETAKQEKVETPEQRPYEVGEWSNSGRTPAARNAHFVDLMLAITGAYDMRSMISHNKVYVYAMGMPSDHEMVERLYALLAPQMVAEADKMLRAGANKEKRRVKVQRREEIPDEERAWGANVEGDDGWDPKRYAAEEGEVGLSMWHWVDTRHGERQAEYTLKAPPSHRLVDVTHEDGTPVYEERAVSTVDARHWRANFYQAFVAETGRRLRASRERALKEAGIDIDDDSNAGGIVLRDKKKEIEESFDEHNKVVLENNERRGRAGYSGAEVSNFDAGAYDSGTKAGREAVHGDERDLGKGQ